jgi:hypothetical protein
VETFANEYFGTRMMNGRSNRFSPLAEGRGGGRRAAPYGQ